MSLKNIVFAACEKIENISSDLFYYFSLRRYSHEVTLLLFKSEPTY